MSANGFRAAALTATLLLTTACGADDNPATGSDPSWSVPCPQPTPDAVQAEDFAELALPCLGGGDDYPVGSVDARPVVVTMWASWCQPCAQEAPVIEKLHAERGDELDVWGVNTQDTSDRGRYFAEDFGWTFPSVFDEKGDALHSQGLTTLPATFVIAADGTTVARFTDGKLDAAQLNSAVEDALKETH